MDAINQMMLNNKRKEKGDITMSELTAKEKIKKYCTVTKEMGRRGNVLIFGKHKYRMNQPVENMTEDEAAAIIKVMELQDYIDKKAGKQATKATKAAKAAKATTVRPEPKLCECGCGKLAKGGSKFLPGHDAKLRSRLRKAAERGDAKAKAALSARGWD